jgi:hypothetical protein
LRMMSREAMQIPFSGAFQTATRSRKSNGLSGNMADAGCHGLVTGMIFFSHQNSPAGYAAQPKLR